MLNSCAADCRCPVSLTVRPLKHHPSHLIEVRTLTRVEPLNLDQCFRDHGNVLLRSAYLTVNDVGATGILVTLPEQPDHQQGLLLMKF
jgi:hypothetical protein